MTDQTKTTDTFKMKLEGSIFSVFIFVVSITANFLRQIKTAQMAEW